MGGIDRMLSREVGGMGRMLFRGGGGMGWIHIVSGSFIKRSNDGGSVWL